MSEARALTEEDKEADGPIYRIVTDMTNIRDTYYIGDVVTLLFIHH
jgi:hypothetical protein